MWETTVTPAASTPKLDGGTIMQELGKGLSSFGSGYTGAKEGQSGNTAFDKFLANFNAAQKAKAAANPMTNYGAGQMMPAGGMSGGMTGMPTQSNGQPTLMQGLMPGAYSNPWAPKGGNAAQVGGINPSAFNMAMPAQQGMF